MVRLSYSETAMHGPAVNAPVFLASHHIPNHGLDNKKLCYRRRTAQRALSVKNLSTVENVVHQIHIKSK